MITVDWRLRTRTLSTRNRTLIMGILNVTPDSFSDGSHAAVETDVAVSRGLALQEQGADIVDVGGESTRPYAESVPIDVELARVVPVVAALCRAGVVASVDTMKAGVAEAAVSAGAEIINDVSGFRNPAMVTVAAATQAGVVVTHMQGLPDTMQIDPSYDDVVTEVARYLADTADKLVTDGIAADRICLDLGIGFGKTVDHNTDLLRSVDRLVALGRPLLVGVSRKGFIGAILEGVGVKTAPDERDLASAVIAGLAVRAGAAVVRTHDVLATLEAVAVSDAIVRSASLGDLRISGEI